jgi:hypothetical protein
MNLRSLSILLILSGLLAGLGGCARSHRPPPPEVGLPVVYERIAVIEFEENTAYTGAGEKFSQALREKLARWTQETDVVHVPADRAPGMAGALRAGAIPVEALEDIRRRFRADAVVLGAVDDEDPYAPGLSIHVTVKMLDRSHGRLVYEISRGWDTSSSSVLQDIQAYYEANRDTREASGGPHLFRIAPRYLRRYVADRIARDIADRIAVPAPAPEPAGGPAGGPE